MESEEVSQQQLFYTLETRRVTVLYPHRQDSRVVKEGRLSQTYFQKTFLGHDLSISYHMASEIKPNASSLHPDRYKINNNDNNKQMEIILYAQFSNFEGSLPLRRSELKRIVETLHLVQRMEVLILKYKMRNQCR